MEAITESDFPEFKQATLAMICAKGDIIGCRWTTVLDQLVAGLVQLL